MSKWCVVVCGVQRHSDVYSPKLVDKSLGLWGSKDRYTFLETIMPSMSYDLYTYKDLGK